MERAYPRFTGSACPAACPMGPAGDDNPVMTDATGTGATGASLSPIREERKVITALFADLAGSTALAERLDAEEVRLIVGEAVARIVHTVEEFGGTVKDLAGDGVLALFGAPLAHEDDAERALRVALKIAQ